MLVLLETRMAEHKRLTEVLKFDSQIQSVAQGLSGEIVIMWKRDLLKLDDITFTLQSIHVIIQVIPDSKPWYFSAIYTSSDFHTRTNIWEELINFSKSHKGDWIVGEDFNEILKASEKFRGRCINNSRSNLFRQCLDHYNLIDLGFKGCKYTWTNKRYKNRLDPILERLDRCAANNSWILGYPHCTVTHFPRTKSDHYPLQVRH
ncbi:hypothetical protein KY284_007815 [Solanum tuberosum]|nr:hypothetical protein KY284_007815 [Solanum tuberosum]